MNRNHFTTTLLFAGAVSATLAPSDAFAAGDYSTYYSGTICHPSTPADASCAVYTQYGVHNSCSTTLTVECPLPLLASPTYFSYLSVFLYDRNTVTENSSCTLQKVGEDGNVLFQSTVSTSGYSLFDYFKKDFRNPGPIFATDGYWHMRCSIPGTDPTVPGWVSHVVAFILN